MSDHAPPSTKLHDVVITNDQTRTEWRADRATIRDGRIVVAASRQPPSGMLEPRTSTFTILAVDAGDRARRYAHVVLDHRASEPPRQYVFA